MAQFNSAQSIAARPDADRRVAIGMSDVSAKLAGLKLALVLSLVTGLALSMTPPAAAQTSTALPTLAPAASPAKSTAPAKVQPAEGGPAWTELSATQKAALAPLQSSWTGMSEGHRRKWIALSASYSTQTPDEQALTHGRMKEWAALSPQQRAQARLNFAQTKKLSPEEKKSKWEAYQALPPEQRSKLASQGKRQPTGAAPAMRPVSPQKLVKVPAVSPDVRHPVRVPAAPKPSSLPAARPATLVQPVLPTAPTAPVAPLASAPSAHPPAQATPVSSQ